MNMIKKFESFNGEIDITIVTFEKGDYVKAMYINGDLYKYGDYYHNKIDELFEGFILGLKYTNTNFKLNKIYCENNDINTSICEDGNTPPKNR